MVWVGVSEGKGRDVSVGEIVIVGSTGEFGIIVCTRFDAEGELLELHPARRKKIMKMKIDLI